MSQYWVKDGQTLLFIGDSITDCGRRGAEAPLGNGYVRLFTELATARFPERRVRYINKGIGGNRVTDLAARWQDDVLYHRPDRLSVKIGINDLHSHLRGAEDGVDPARFAAVYEQILEITQGELGCPLVLLTPFYISTDHNGQTFRSQVLELLPRYIEVVEQLAERFDARLVRLQDVFQTATPVPRRRHLLSRTSPPQPSRTFGDSPSSDGCPDCVVETTRRECGGDESL